MYQIINRTLHVPPDMPESEVMKMAEGFAAREMAGSRLLVDMLAEGEDTIDGVKFDRYAVLVYLLSNAARV